MLRILTIILLTIPICLFGQSRNIIVVVDSITLAEPDAEMYNFKILVGHRDIFRDVKNVEDVIRNYSKYPNYQVSVNLIEDSSTIKIFIDNNVSYLEIAGAYKLQIDTLRIDNLLLYKNLTRSVSKCNISWYRIPTNGEKISVTKSRSYSYTTKPKLNLTNYSIKINGKVYNTELREETIGTVNISHGYKPRKYKNKKDEYRKCARKFYDHCNSTIYMKKGQIEL